MNPFDPVKLGLVFAFVTTAACAPKPADTNAPQDAGRPPDSAPIAGLERVISDAGAKDGAPAEPRLIALGYAPVKIHRQKRFVWRQIAEVNWQAVAEDLPPLPPELEPDATSCPTGMVLVEGKYLLDERGRDDTDGVLLAQNSTCSYWRTQNDHGLNGLCDKFDPEKWHSVAATLPTKPMRFCIDRYEYPNAYGEFPLVVARFVEGQAYCKKEHKRLCTESEWTFACEGDEGRPYPYGYERDNSACLSGILAPAPDKDTLRPRTLPHTAAGLDLAWQGKRSGEFSKCKSPFGVFDLTGNVDEWTTNVRRYGYPMIMKGGHWGPARQRCRPQTRGHGPMYVRYDQGFRCCSDS